MELLHWCTTHSEMHWPKSSSPRVWSGCLLPEKAKPRGAVSTQNLSRGSQSCPSTFRHKCTETMRDHKGEGSIAKGKLERTIPLISACPQKWMSSLLYSFDFDHKTSKQNCFPPFLFLLFVCMFPCSSPIFSLYPASSFSYNHNWHKNGRKWEENILIHFTEMQLSLQL